jgi:hypothetical protein
MRPTVAAEIQHRTKGEMPACLVLAADTNAAYVYKPTPDFDVA